MRNNIKTLVIATISVIGICLVQSCKKETTSDNPATNQAPVITFADELLPAAGSQYVIIDSGMALHLQFTATDDRGLASGMVHVIKSTGEHLFDTMFPISGQTSYMFHQHYQPAAFADTTLGSVVVMITDNDNAMTTSTAHIEFLP